MKKPQNKEDFMPLGELVGQFIKDNQRLEEGLTKINVADIWKEKMGPGVNSYTTSVSLKRDTLFVKLSNSVLRQELSYGKTKIIAMINEALGKEVVTKLVLA